MMRTILAAFLAVLTSAALAGETQPYQVVSEDGAPQALHIAVRLERRMSEPDLKAVSEALKARHSPDKTLAAVSFYLPAMKLTQSPWAEARFAPASKITVNGLGLNEEAAYRAEAESDPRDVIGVWITAAPAVPGLLTIWRDKYGKTFAEWRLRNGQKTSDELEESKAKSGRRFDVVGANGGYFLMTWGGDLELGEKSAVIAAAERLQIDRSKAAKLAKAAAAKPAAVSTTSPSVHKVPSQVAGELGKVNAAVIKPEAKASVPHRKSRATETSDQPKVNAGGGLSKAMMR